MDSGQSLFKSDVTISDSNKLGEVSNYHLKLLGVHAADHRMLLNSLGLLGSVGAVMFATFALWPCNNAFFA